MVMRPETNPQSDESGASFTPIDPNCWMQRAKHSPVRSLIHRLIGFYFEVTWNMSNNSPVLECLVARKQEHFENKGQKLQ